MKFSIIDHPGFFIGLVLTLTAIINPLELIAQNGPRISFQGTLKKANGAPVEDGDYSFEFTLYDSQSGGSPLNLQGTSTPWKESLDLTVTGGIYSHNLGSVTDLVASHFSARIYLNIKVGGKDLVPRTEMTYAPYAFSVSRAQEVVCSGAVGDVKYSILPPDKFKDVNGDCWVPMDGRNLGTSDELYQLGITSIPNAGGLFLRAQDFAVVSGGESWKPKNSSDNDPNRTATTTIGLQSDGLGTHNHTGSTSTDGSHTHRFTAWHANFSHNSSAPVEGSMKDDGDGSFDVYVDAAGNHSHSFTTNSTGGAETRPKNLNLWIYIRIN